MNTKAGGVKYRQTMINKYGSEEAWKAHVKLVSSKGGKQVQSQPRGFAAATLEQRQSWGKKGGSVKKEQRNE